jgi:glycolate oxidase iron-sulfur subunit
MRITHRELSDGIVEDKITNIMASGASLVVTGCPGCRMQITDALRRAGSDIGVVHTVQVLEAALQNEKSVEQGVNNKIKNGSLRLQPAKI